MNLASLLLTTVKRYEAARLQCAACPKSDRAECIAAYIRRPTSHPAPPQPKKTLSR